MPRIALFLLMSLVLLSCASQKTHERPKTSDALEELKAGNKDRARNILIQRCDAKDRSACVLLAHLNYNEHKRKESIKYAIKACELNSPWGCLRFAHALLEEGNLSKARTFYEKFSIEHEAQLGLALINYLEKKTELAHKTAEDLCKINYTKGCEIRAIFATIEKDYSTAQANLAKCGMEESCASRLSINSFILDQRSLGVEKTRISCALFGGKPCRLQKLLEMQKSDKNLISNLKKKCNKNDSESCYYLGLQLSLNLKSMEQADRYNKKACALGNGQGCLELSNVHPLLIYTNHRESLEQANEICHKNTGRGCFLLFELESTDDSAYLKSLVEKGCALNDPSSCSALGQILWSNNMAEAKLKYDQACKEAYLPGCYWSLQASSVSEEAKEAELKKLCQQNLKQACEDLGDKLIHKNEKDKARAFYELACKLGSDQSCFQKVELTAMDDETRISSYKDMCDHANPYACLKAGDLLGKDTMAKEYLKKGCDKAHSDSCDLLGYILHTENNVDEAREFYQRSCDLGSIYGCRQLEKLTLVQ